MRIITLDGSDVGWVQCFTQEGELFIAELVVDGPFQRRGIGTEVITRVIGEAARLGVPIRELHFPIVQFESLDAAELARVVRDQSQTVPESSGGNTGVCVGEKGHSKERHSSN